MDNAVATVSRGGPGGARPGAGRPTGPSSVRVWRAFEARVRSAANQVLTREAIIALAKGDPMRFIERVVIPLISLDKRQAMTGRLGVSVGEGAAKTQFVLDFGGDDQPPAEAEGRVLDTLEAFGQGTQPRE